MNIRKIHSVTYDKIASEYNDRHLHHFWVEEFTFFASLLRGKKVVDLGCGAGRDADVFVKNMFDYTGIDASEGMLKVARKRVPEGRFEKMDFFKTSFPDQSFDGFWAAASFLHVPKKEIPDVLREAKRIIKKNGIGFISVKEKVLINEGIIEESKYGGIKRYFSFFTTTELKNILERNDFRVIKSGVYLEDDEEKTRWLTFFVSPKN